MNNPEYTSLVDLGEKAVSHREEVDKVKAAIGITHGYYDAWIYGFLENKKFNIEETVAKLHRRFAMEITELGTIDTSDFMHESLRKGIIQDIGVDKLGRVTFYINTKRDFPEAKYREEQRKTFDMFVSYGTRLREDNKRCQMVMLINQDDASMSKNLDMKFEADVALRISKFYPGMVDKMFVCKMGRTLAAMAKPIFRTLPAIVSDRIEIITEKDIKNGALLEYFDESVLPIDLGGTNDCDNQEHWNDYADRVESYFKGLKNAVNNRGLTVKEWELQELGIYPEGGGPASPARSAEDGGGDPLSLGQTVNSMTFHSFATNASFIDQPLQTCCSEDFDTSSLPEGRGTINPSWTEIMQPIPKQMAIFFLDELLRWRDFTEAEEASDRAKIVAACDAGISEIDKHEVTEAVVRKQKVKATCCSCFSPE